MAASYTHSQKSRAVKLELYAGHDDGILNYSVINENMYCFFLTLLPVVLGQLRADVHFGADNDRFDLTPLIREGAYDQWNNVVGVRRDYGIVNPSDESHSPAADAAKKFMNALRRFQKDYNQNLVWNENEGRKSYERTIQDQLISEDQRRDLLSYLQKNQMKTRRSDSQEREVRMYHAVPIVMKVEGIMQVPLGGE